MNAHFQVFKGAPRWRDPTFWMFVAIYWADLAWGVYRDRGLWAISFWNPLCLLLMLPPRLYLSKNWLVNLGSTWVFSRALRFEAIESYSYWEDPNPPDKNQNVSVHLTLVRAKGPRRRPVFVSIQKGARLAAFLAAMESRGVPSLEQKFKKIFADLELPGAVFSPPFPASKPNARRFIGFCIARCLKFSPEELRFQFVQNRDGSRATETRGARFDHRERGLQIADAARRFHSHFWPHGLAH